MAQGQQRGPERRPGYEDGVLEGFLEELVFELSLEECVRNSQVSGRGLGTQVGRTAHTEGRRKKGGSHRSTGWLENT